MGQPVETRESPRLRESEIPAFPSKDRNLTFEISTSVARRRPAPQQLFLRPEFRR